MDRPQLGEALVRLVRMSEELSASGQRRVTAEEAGELAGLVVVVVGALLAEQVEGRVLAEPLRIDLTDGRLTRAAETLAGARGRQGRSSVWAVEPTDPEHAAAPTAVRADVVELIQKLNRLL